MRGTHVKRFLWETRERSCNEVAVAAGRGGSPWLLSPSQHLSARASGGWGQQPPRAMGFRLPSFVLEEGRRKPKQAHHSSHLHLGRSLIQWLWAATYPIPFYSFFSQALLVCFHAMVLSPFSFSQGYSLTTTPTSPEFIWEHEYAAQEALIQTGSSCCAFTGLNSYHLYSCYLYTCLQTPQKCSYV